MAGGRPSKYRADFHPDDFLRLSKAGKVLAQIARDWEVDRSTIHDWAEKHKEFANTIKRGHQWAEAWWLDYFQGVAMGKVPKANLGAGVWVTKNAFGYSDKIETKEESKQVVSYKLNWADEDDGKDNLSKTPNTASKKN